MASPDAKRYRPVKTPTVLQMEAAECGAAALGIILEYHGRYVPLEVLREQCGVSRDGSNALYIKETAKRHGLEVKAFRKPAEGLTNRRTPFLVFWESNHFLVVEGFGRRQVYLNDPAIGRRKVSLDEFRRSYSGIAFTFEIGAQFVKQGGRPSTLLGLVRRLSRSRAAMAFVILAGLALVIPNLAAAAFQRVFLDGILVEGHREWLASVAPGYRCDRIAAAGRGRTPAGLPDPAGNPTHARRVAGLHATRPAAPRGFLPASLHRRHRDQGPSGGPRGRADLRRACDDGGQPADTRGLHRRDAAVRSDPDGDRGRHQQPEPGGAPAARPLAGRPQPDDRATEGPAHGGRHVGDPDRREHQGDRLRVGPAHPMDRRASPDDQRRAGAGCLRRTPRCAAAAPGRLDDDPGPRRSAATRSWPAH